MFTSKNPLLFILQLLVILAMVLGSFWLARELGEPLTVLGAVIALILMPEFPVVNAPAPGGDDDDDPGDYDGTGSMGFGANPK